MSTMAIRPKNWHLEMRAALASATERQVFDVHFVHFREVASATDTWRFLATELCEAELPSLATVKRVVSALLRRAGQYRS